MQSGRWAMKLAFIAAAIGAGLWFQSFWLFFWICLIPIAIFAEERRQVKIEIERRTLRRLREEDGDTSD